jgi:hypothetical protein
MVLNELDDRNEDSPPQTTLENWFEVFREGTDFDQIVGVLGLTPEEQADHHLPSHHEVLDKQSETAEVGCQTSYAAHEDQDVATIGYLVALVVELGSPTTPDFMRTEGEGFVRSSVLQNETPHIALDGINVWLYSPKDALSVLDQSSDPTVVAGRAGGALHDQRKSGDIGGTRDDGGAQ